MIELRDKDEPIYDDRHYLALVGLGEMGEGEILKVNLGESVICGRSRHCQWSLKRTPAFLKAENGTREKLRTSLAWRATSRRHCRIAFLAPDMVDVQNLSVNGTIVDGHQVDRVVLTDCRRNIHQIQLGKHGVTLELRPGSLPVS